MPAAKRATKKTGKKAAATGPLRVGVLGQGRSGLDIHCRWFLQAPRQYKVVAIADLLKDRRQRAATEMGCDTYADYRDLLERDDLDLVVNSLPSFQHPPVTMEALKAGHNVVCEKPLAWNPAIVDDMVAAARGARRILAPFQQSRNAPYFQQIRKVIASGILGEIRQIRIQANGYARRWDWQTVQEYKGGNLLNTGPHFVDQAVCLLDFKTPEVTCFMERANTFGDAEDYVKVLLRAKGKPIIDLEISSCDAYPGDLYNISGTRGGMTGGGGGLRWRYYDPKKAPKQRLLRSPLPGPSYCGENLKLTEKTWKPTKAQQNAFQYMSKCFYDHLFKVLRQGAPLQVTPQQVRVQMQVMEACHQQNRLSRLPAKGWPKGK